MTGRRGRPLRLLFSYGRPAPLAPEAAADQARGGITTALLALTRELAARGHDVHVVARCERAVQRDGVSFHPRGAFAALAAGGPVFDALVAVPELLPLVAPVAARARVVWSGNAFATGDCLLSADHPWAPQLGRSGLVARVLPLALAAADVDAFVAKSQWQADQQRAIVGLPAPTLRVIYNGVALQHYLGAHHEAAPLRVVYASQARRGLDHLLAMWPAIRAAAGPVELHVCGYEYPPDTGPAAGPSGPVSPDDGVVWRGRLGKVELAQELGRAAVMGYPNTLRETFCTAVAEAQAAGLPVVTSDRAGLAERVRHGVTGTLVPGDPGSDAYRAAFCAALVALLTDPGLRARQGAAARAHAHHAYSWPRIAGQWEDTLQGLASRPARLPQTRIDVRSPAARTVSDRGAQATIPAPLVRQWWDQRWAEYGLPGGGPTPLVG